MANKETKAVKRMRVLIVDATKRFIEKNHLGESKPVKKTSDKNAKILKVLNTADFGCRREDVASLIGAVVGVDFVEQLDKESNGAVLKFEKFVAVVLTANPNSHDYTIGQVVITGDGGSGAYKQDGTQGNVLPYDEDYKKSMRAATKQEIADIPAPSIDKIASKMGIIFLT